MPDESPPPSGPADDDLEARFRRIVAGFDLDEAARDTPSSGSDDDADEHDPDHATDDGDGRAEGAAAEPAAAVDPADQLPGPRPDDVFEPRLSDRLDPSDVDDDLTDDDHFVPPEPEPVEVDPWARAAWAGALGGPALLVVITVFSVDVPRWLAGAAVAAFVVGVVVLLTRYSRDDRDDGWDDGAVV